ncbi:hypothetical protein DFQ28_003109 [Apophysomyces sp. BC1034]|nr:hypothetical protein DFQ30_009971 [Apophysomyces sp. BC1015]KAG0183158.1 hypothetical protein DFQ29_009234 [Apophysomyces sp. BC1021]KAG0189681.1 hypothetical protein DFQ28_003109 [Apophysomyces sp. BC1034]
MPRALLEKRDIDLASFHDWSVEMDVLCCGICGTDIHVFDSGWGPSRYPVVCGHEFVGRVTRVGKNVTHLKEGDRAGVGCQSGSCHKCDLCKNGRENVCEDRMIWTFNDFLDTGERANGGFADKWRGDGRFAVKIPDELASEVAASFMCGGVTTYNALRKNHVGPGSSVAVLGLGGLGHYGVQWAKAMGADNVVAFDIVPEKAKDAEVLGCNYVLIQNEDDVAKHYKSFTHILATKIVNKSWSQYLNLLKNGGYFIMCDVPEEPVAGINPIIFVTKEVTLAGTCIGSPKVIQECLEFAVEKGVRTWTNTFPMEKINEAVQFVRNNQARYRTVVVNE